MPLPPYSQRLFAAFAEESRALTRQRNSELPPAVRAQIDSVNDMMARRDEQSSGEMPDDDRFGDAEDAERIGDADERQTSAPPVALLMGADLAVPVPDPDYLIRELGLTAGAGAPHLVAGYGFSGKTLAVHALGLMLAADGAVWGVYVAQPRRPRRVLLVDLEQGRRLTLRRLQRLARAQGVDIASLGDALAVAVMPALTLDAAHLDAWHALMEGRDVIVIDSLRAATPGQDENSSEIREALDMLGSLSEKTGCRAIVIHHSRKPTENDSGARYSVRGSSALFDACDAAYVFSAEKDEPIRVECVKAREHGELVEPIALVISDVEQDGDPRAGLAVSVHGVELVAQQHAARRANAERAQVAADVVAIEGVLLGSPGLGTRSLRVACRLAGITRSDRVDAALASLGGRVVVRDEVRGRARVAAHYLDQAPHLNAPVPSVPTGAHACPTEVQAHVPRCVALGTPQPNSSEPNSPLGTRGNLEPVPSVPGHTSEGDEKP